MTGVILDISGGEIALLGDEDLRNLVARLSEAEMRQRRYPTSAVTSGGEQEAPDGGVDVRVQLPAATAIEGYVPRPATAFQVKKSDMPRTAILKEMRPKGKVRAVLRELAAQAGAYVIVSSNGSASDSALRERRKAMAEAMKGVKNARSLHLDFYDRGRMATWLREHPGFIPWVRQRIGKAMRGWQSYGAWANASEDVSAEYLADDKALIKTGKKEEGEGISGLEGMRHVRSILRETQKIVRLVGLSGVGKTRFVQALFDERVGEQALDPSLVLYTNLGDDPDPQPIGMVSDLIAARRRAIVVVDNCPPDLHRRLSEVCRSAQSTVSAITVEYDIRDDEPDETEVVRIEPSSIELISKLIKCRFPDVSMVDVGTVAQFSGGNARIAIALANTIGKNETISGLGDEDLFRRLFEQRHGHNDPLLLAAQVCSLVYSFEGEAVSGADAELPILAGMIGRTTDEVFHAVAELKRRDLVQQRGVWCAVLPHAISNRLATMALQNIPMAKVEAHLVTGASERMLSSFSRRLGYLHSSPQSVALVERWLADGGLLGNVTGLNDLGRALLNNVAPVAPEAVLGALERAPCQSLAGHTSFNRLLRSLAYEPALFERCAETLAAVVEAEEPESQQADTASCFVAMFFIYLSGTHATVEQRLRVLEAQLRSGNTAREKLGLEALRAMLEAWHFSSGFQFEFGARSRDHGYRPRTNAELQQWFAPVLKFAEGYAVSSHPIAPLVRTIIGEKFRGLWKMAVMYDDLERVCQSIRKASFWRDGWIGIRRTLRFDAEEMDPAAKARLEALERVLRPSDLVQKVRSLVLARPGGNLELDDFDIEDDTGAATMLQRRDAIAVALGKETATDAVAFKELLPELINGSGLLWMFGRGLALGTQCPDAVWEPLTSRFAATEAKKRNTQVLSGFISGINDNDPNRANLLLDDALADAVLATYFPALQVAIPIDEQGVARLGQALAKAPIWGFQILALGRASEPIAGSDLRGLLQAIAAKPEGFKVAADILYMRLFSEKDQKKADDPELIAAGRELLERLEFDKGDHSKDHEIGALIEYCLSGKDGAQSAGLLCKRFMQAVSKYETYAFDCDNFVRNLFKAQPMEMLDGFFGGTAVESNVGRQIMEDVVDDRTNPLDAVSQDEIFSWCQRDPAERYPIMASVITLFRRANDKEPLEWSDMAQALLERAPDGMVVLKQYVGRFRPRSWSGSLAATMEAPLAPLRKLEEHPETSLAEFAKTEGMRLRREVDAQRRRETEVDKQSDERFE